MPHSLRVKIKGLRYKGLITDKDCDRLRKALDNEDVLDKIRAEIMENINDLDVQSCDDDIDKGYAIGLETALGIVDKYKTESEAEDEI